MACGQFWLRLWSCGCIYEGGDGGCLRIGKAEDRKVVYNMSRERERKLFCFHLNFTYFYLFLFSGNNRVILTVT